MQCVPPLQYPSVLCDPTVPELGADWVGAPLGHAAHPHQRLPGEEEDYVERGAQAHVAGEDGQGEKMESEGRGGGAREDKDE